MGYIFVTFYVTMAAAGYVVEFLFEALGYSTEPQRCRLDLWHSVELYHCTQPHLPGSRTRATGAISPNGWLAYAEDDKSA